MPAEPSLREIHGGLGQPMSCRDGAVIDGATREFQPAFSSRLAYPARRCRSPKPVGLGARVTPNQAATPAAAAALVVGTHVLVTRTRLGRAMRAVAESPGLARVGGIDVEGVIRATWVIGGAPAGASGVVVGVVVQVRPAMGFDVLLPLFAAAILRGIGLVPGAVVGGLPIAAGWLGAASVC